MYSMFMYCTLLVCTLYCRYSELPNLLKKQHITVKHVEKHQLHACSPVPLTIKAVILFITCVPHRMGTAFQLIGSYDFV